MMRSKVFCLLLFLCLLPVLGMSANFYVSKSGNNSNDGSQYSPWKSMQYAINTNIVNSGDTIYVAPGIYSEILHIKKSVNLFGATHGVNKKNYPPTSSIGMDSTVESIIAYGATTSSVIFINVDNVNLDGFAIYNQTGTTMLICLDQKTTDYTNVKIVNNIIGITTSGSYYYQPSGIRVDGPSNHLRKLYIAHNKIQYIQGIGITLYGSVGVKNVDNNTNATCTYAGTIIEDNEIICNTCSGIELLGGIQGGENQKNHIIIQNNDISNNGYLLNTCYQNYKYGNGISMTRDTTDYVYDDAHGCQNILITGNNISNNEKNGIYMGPVNKNIYIKGNNIQNNGFNTFSWTNWWSNWDGIKIDLDEAYYTKPLSVIFPANDIYAPGGPYAYSTTILMNICTTYNQLENIYIQNNNIQGNDAYGVRVTEQPTLGNVLATYNNWGANDGPSPSGSGDTISNYIDYIPFSLGTCQSGLAVIDGSTSVVSADSANIDFDFTDGSIGSGGTINAVLAYSNPTGSTSGNDLTEANSINKVWYLSTDMSGFSVTLVFKYDDVDVPVGVNEANLIPLRSSDGGVTWQAVTGTVTHDTVNNIITVSGVTEFSLWAFADSGMVPVELSDFTVE